MPGDDGDHGAAMSAVVDGEARGRASWGEGTMLGGWGTETAALISTTIDRSQRTTSNQDKARSSQPHVGVCP